VLSFPKKKVEPPQLPAEPAEPAEKTVKKKKSIKKRAALVPRVIEEECQLRIWAWMYQITQIYRFQI
jgi:hypothetical protein